MKTDASTKKKSQSAIPSAKTGSKPLVISLAEVAGILGICRQSAYSAARRGEIPGTLRIGRRIVVSRKKFFEALGHADV